MTPIEQAIEDNARIAFQKWAELRGYKISSRYGYGSLMAGKYRSEALQALWESYKAGLATCDTVPHNVTPDVTEERVARAIDRELNESISAQGYRYDARDPVQVYKDALKSRDLAKAAMNTRAGEKA